MCFYFTHLYAPYQRSHRESTQNYSLGTFPGTVSFCKHESTFFISKLLTVANIRVPHQVYLKKIIGHHL